MIKKTLLTLTALAAIAAGSMKATAYTGENTAPRPEIYPDAMVVDEIDKENDIVYIKTCAGNIYSFYGVEDWMVGDIVAVIMSDNGTPETITDDIIITTRYAGYTDLLIR